jgi:2-succinyl-6-hydroxy-2,4-cyclohexadiene-1-carboxylate synthase
MNEVLIPKYSLSPPADAPAVLFLHGFLGCRYDWDELAGLIGDRYRCLRVDLPGHHHSCQQLPSNEYSMPQTARLMIELLDHCEIGSCCLVGYSMGGRLGLYLLTHFPERFTMAVIESASPGLRTEAERIARRIDDEKLAKHLREEPFNNFLSYWYNQPLFQTMDQTSTRFATLLKRRGNHDPNGLALSLEQIGTGAMPSLWDKLPQIEVPVMFVAGEKDAKFNRLAGEMANLCPRGRATIIQGAGHNVHFERPAEYSRALIDFLGANQ